MATSTVSGSGSVSNVCTSLDIVTKRIDVYELYAVVNQEDFVDKTFFHKAHIDQAQFNRTYINQTHLNQTYLD